MGTRCWRTRRTPSRRCSNRRHVGRRSRRHRSPSRWHGLRRCIVRSPGCRATRRVRPAGHQRHLRWPRHPARGAAVLPAIDRAWRDEGTSAHDQPPHLEPPPRAPGQPADRCVLWAGPTSPRRPVVDYRRALQRPAPSSPPPNPKTPCASRWNPLRSTRLPSGAVTVRPWPSRARRAPHPGLGVLRSLADLPARSSWLISRPALNHPPSGSSPSSGLGCSASALTGYRGSAHPFPLLSRSSPPAARCS